MFVGDVQPTVKKLFELASNIIIPESPGLVTMFDTPLMVDGLFGKMVRDPVPLFLKLAYHPGVIDA